MDKPSLGSDGRIHGGHSLHEAHDQTKCKNGHTGIWRTVECGGLAGSDRDIIECSECGAQRNIACNFDDEYS